MVQGPAKMEFHYSVGKEKKGEAQSVNFHDLAMDSGENLNSDTDDAETRRRYVKGEAPRLIRVGPHKASVQILFWHILCVASRL